VYLDVLGHVSATKAAIGSWPSGRGQPSKVAVTENAARRTEHSVTNSFIRTGIVAWQRRWRQAPPGQSAGTAPRGSVRLAELTASGGNRPGARRWLTRQRSRTFNPTSLARGKSRPTLYARGQDLRPNALLPEAVLQQIAPEHVRIPLVKLCVYWA